MKKAIAIMGMIVLYLAIPVEKSQAQIPIVNIISAAVKKVITALDLKVQQLQNQTIALQNAEQQLENSLSLNKLNDISGWLNKEKDLYKRYYQELAEVKSIIVDYDEVKKIISQQRQLLSEYQSGYALFSRDKHFSTEEISYMGDIYDGIFQESLRSLDEVMGAVKTFSTQMDDAERIHRIHKAAGGMQANLDHLRQFNQQNVTLSLARAREGQDRQSVRQLYGLQ
jgi:hypothetical protein